MVDDATMINLTTVEDDLLSGDIALANCQKQVHRVDLRRVLLRVHRRIVNALPVTRPEEAERLGVLNREIQAVLNS